MPTFETMLTTGEVRFLTESFFPENPGKYVAMFEPDGEYAVKARIDVIDDAAAGLFQREVERMRQARLALDRIARLAPPPRVPRDETLDGGTA